MKHLKKLFFAASMVILFTACNKVKDLPHYSNGSATVLTSSVNMVSTAPGRFSQKCITLSWTDPKYAEDSSKYKYIVEIDSTGRNFSKEYKLIITGTRSTTLTGRQFNDIMAGLGLAAGAPSALEVKVTSSYGNNNEAYASNVLAIQTTPYIVPLTIVPSSLNPLTLMIANAASPAISFSWNATQYGTNTFTYAVQIDTAGGKFASPQQFSTGDSLTRSFSVADLNSAAIIAGVPGGSTSSLEVRVVAFLANKTTPSVISNAVNIAVTTYVSFLYLWVPGDYQGWSPSSAPQLGATSPDLNNFEGYVNVPVGGSYLFKITNANDWDHIAYGGSNGALSTSGDNLTWPNGAAYYYLKANPASLTWSALPVTWAIIGDATPNGWGGDTPMAYDAVNNVWVINSVPLTPNSLKFRANATWNDAHFPNGNSNLGGSLNALNYGGDNISISAAGNYKIVLDLSHPLKIHDNDN